MIFSRRLIFLLAFFCYFASTAALAKSIRYVKCKQPGFVCIKVKRGQSWRGLFPDDRERAIVKRLNHWNGYTYKNQIIKVPEDIAVVGYDNIPLAEFIRPPLTTVQQDTKLAGELLVESLIARIYDKDVKATTLPVQLIVRESCGSKS